MSWARPHLYGVETLDQQVHRLREEADPYPGVSSLDEARVDRHRNLSPEPSRVLLLRSASPSLGKDGSVPAVLARFGQGRAGHGADFDAVYERFMSKVRTTDGGCWEWTAARVRGGYGKFKLDGRSLIAHRVSYALHMGPIPDDLELDHVCRNRWCVNPTHLEPVTHAENILRGIPYRKPPVRSRKAHCKHGHPMDDENTYVSPQGRHECRTCKRDRAQARGPRDPHDDYDLPPAA